jgi:3-dehydroquinate dehydratase-2
VKVLVLSGPNLDRLGIREPEIYGTGTYAELADACRETATRLGLDVDMRQTADEAEMIRWLHESADARLPVVLNAGAWTHYSYAIRDACAGHPAPLIEVHMSQIAAREAFRHESVLSAVVTGTITGLGVDSYLLALHAIAARIRH